MIKQLRRHRRLLLGSAFWLIAGCSWLWLQPLAHASYHADRLIDNYPFINARSMSANDIQSFLNDKNSGIKGLTDTVSGCSAYMSQPGHYGSDCGKKITAAKIIFDAANTYGLSPRVILATLQKEQSLVTDPSPSSSQTHCAMGYQSCASGYLGFFTQVDWGTYQLRRNYETSQGHTYLGGTQYACDHRTSLYSAPLVAGNRVTFANPGGHSRTITIANAATASLYCYTPYVGPFSETGYSGSYNFVVSYEAWWGSTLANPIRLTYVRQHSNESGGSALIEYSLITQPTANVTIPLTIDNASEASFNPSSSDTTSSLTITPANWNKPANNTITIYGVNDAIGDGDVGYHVIAGRPTSTDDAFGSLASSDTPNASLINDDNENDVALGGDWNGDRRSDIGLKRGNQYLLSYDFNGSAEVSFGYGRWGDTPIAGDWNGDHKFDIGVRRGNVFYLNTGHDGRAEVSFGYGRTDDIPIAGDWNGDGKWTVGVYRPSTREFFLTNTNRSHTDASFGYGTVGDKPLAGDWNGDGKTTVGVYRPSTRQFFLNNSNRNHPADISFSFGAVGDKPLVGDWDKDKKYEIGVRRGKVNYLTYDNNGSAEVSFSFGR